MKNGAVKTSNKKIPKGQSEEEVAQFWLTHDSSEYADRSKMEMPNLHRATHVVPVSIPNDEYGQISELAAARKKTLAEMIGLILQSGLKELRMNALN